jgi:hypothetical protein
MQHRGQLFFAGMVRAFCLGLLIASAPSLANEQEVSDAQIWQSIIRESINSYPRTCPCPYSANALGGRCGDRSAYRRGDRASPMCYPQDIPDEHIARYRERLNQ